MAGFAGKKRAWGKLEDEWKAALGKRPFLHLNKMKFRSVRDKDLLEELAPIPYDCRLKAVYGSVNVSDYEDLIQGTVAEFHWAEGPICLATRSPN